MASLFIAVLLPGNWSGAVRAETPPSKITTTLQPGANLVGWLGAETDIESVINTIPALDAIWAQDPYSLTWVVASPHVPVDFHTLWFLDSYMPLIVHIGGDQPVEWTRPVVPRSTAVELQPGFQLITWSGPDSMSIAALLRGIAGSVREAHVWDPVRQQYHVYDPSSPKHLESIPLVNHGDAFWLDARRSINWRQPNGVLPEIRFPGGAPQHVRETVRTDLESALHFYATEYGVGPDTSDLIIMVPRDVNSLISALETEYDTDEWDEQWRSDMREQWQEAGGWFAIWPLYIVVKRSRWTGSTFTWQDGRYTLTHEIFHAIQYNSPFPPATTIPWLLEGSAEFMAARHAVLDGIETWDEIYSRVHARLRDELPALEHGEDLGSETTPSWVYRLGFLASDLLARRVDDGALVEFYLFSRSLADGPWEQYFQEAFGVSVSDFYLEFCRFRRGLPTDDSAFCRDTDVRVLTGSLMDSDGRPVEDAWVYATWQIDDSTRDNAAQTDEAGKFAIRMPSHSASGDIHLRVEFPDCLTYTWYSADGLDADPEADSPITIRGSITEIELRKPAEVCPQIRGVVADSDGTGRSDVQVEILPISGDYGKARTGADGSFAITAPTAGEYQLSIELVPGCKAWWKEDGSVTTQQDEAGTVSVMGGDLDDVRVVISEGICEWEIQGRLLNANGNGIERVWVSLYRGDSLFWGLSVRTAADGSFAITVPAPGRYHLAIRGRGCQGFYQHNGITTEQDDASLIDVVDGHVSDFVFQVPEGACG